MTAEKEPRTFTGAVGVADRRLALVSDDPRRIEAFRREHPGVREIDGTGKVLMPGLINTHCHVAMTLQRGYADDIALMKWLHEYIWPFEAQQTPDEIVLGAEMGIVEMLLGGVTTFVDMYWHENRIAEAVRRLGIRAMLGASYLDTTLGGFCRRCGADDRHHGRLRPHPVGRGAPFALHLFAGVVAAGQGAGTPPRTLVHDPYFRNRRRGAYRAGALRYYFCPASRYPRYSRRPDDRCALRSRRSTGISASCGSAEWPCRTTPRAT